MVFGRYVYLVEKSALWKAQFCYHIKLPYRYRPLIYWNRFTGIQTLARTTAMTAPANTFPYGPAVELLTLGFPMCKRMNIT